ncbi:2OG-Fe(II) oxygenase [Euzebya pacifica]|uniref:2OG-Fe(II) oxygenase n=1 Tax=Euzebya pacifica TaxID=1608957 RepID=UPI0030F7420B
MFDRLGPDDVVVDPFPHAVVHDALPDEVYERLARTRQAGPATGANVRSVVPGWVLQRLPHVDPAWRDFVGRHLTVDMAVRVAEVVADHWAPPLPTAAALETASWSLVGADMIPPGLGDPMPADAEVRVDCRLETISASPAEAGSHRQQHLDLPSRLFSALLYMRHPDDDTDGGGLVLYRWRDGAPTTFADDLELSADRVEPVVTVPYAPNTLVVFPNSPRALHGAEVRAATTFERAYAFLTAEVDHNLW